MQQSVPCIIMMSAHRLNFHFGLNCIWPVGPMWGKQCGTFFFLALPSGEFNLSPTTEHFAVVPTATVRVDRPHQQGKDPREICLKL
jgi:hypothetical protein